MDTKYTNEPTDSVLKLLESSILEDVILGVVWCQKNLGDNWCLHNFTYISGLKTQKYPTKGDGSSMRDNIVVFPNFSVLIGDTCIEAYNNKDLYDDSSAIYHKFNEL